MHLEIFKHFYNCRSFSWALSMDGKVPLSEGLEHPDLPGKPQVEIY